MLLYDKQEIIYDPCMITEIIQGKYTMETISTIVGEIN